jgi:cysteine desulfurase
MIYLDWASTSPPEPSILAEAALRVAELFGNPSSRHALGLEARSALEDARARLLAALGASSGKVVFTSGGTEADAIPLLALVRRALGARRDGSVKRLHIIASEIEHAAVYEQALLLKSLGFGLSLVSPLPDGRLDPTAVASAVEEDTALVAVMAVNNETGAIQPIAEIAASVAEASAALGRRPPRLHVDAVQALAKVEFDPAASGAASAAYSAHKLRGPRGVGALWLSSDSAPESLAVGGGQEASVRPGTESLQGAWAFAAAAQAARSSFAQRVERASLLEARLLAGLAAIPGALPLPLGRRSGDPRYSPFVLSAAFPGLPGEVLARALSDRGIAVSTGSACSSNSRKSGRRVLRAMGLGEELSNASIRLSWGELSTEGDIDAFLEAAASAYRELKA